MDPHQPDAGDLVDHAANPPASGGGGEPAGAALDLPGAADARRRRRAAGLDLGRVVLPELSPLANVSVMRASSWPDTGSRQCCSTVVAAPSRDSTPTARTVIGTLPAAQVKSPPGVSVAENVPCTAIRDAVCAAAGEALTSPADAHAAKQQIIVGIARLVRPMVGLPSQALVLV